MTLAVWVLTAAAAAGTILALMHLRAVDDETRPPAWAGIAHGLAGAVGVGLLILALQGPARAVQAGAGGFGVTAAWLFAAALVSGIAIWTRKRRGSTVLIAIHAGAAVTGYVLVLAWDALGS